jgi:fumarate reductase subunit D
VYATEKLDFPLPVLFVQDGAVSLLFLLWLILLLILLLLLLRLLYNATTSKNAVAASASVGGAFVVLLLLSATVIAYLERVDDGAEVSLLPMAAADVPVLLFGGIIVLIAVVSLCFYLFHRKSSK